MRVEKMQIIILEGIAASGKTSVKNKLAEAFVEKGINFSIVEEDETLMPILNNTDRQTSSNLLKNVIDKALKEEKDFIIFDRLFFTHIFRANSSIEDFREIEKMIQSQSLLVFLKIDESKIPERINYARKHREKSWDEYVSNKGSDEEIYQYYINQQRLLLGLLKKTSLEYKVYDTTDIDFESVTKNILVSVSGSKPFAFRRG